MPKRDLYEVVSNDYYKMSREELAIIAKEALFKLYELLGDTEYNKAIKDIYEDNGLNFEEEE